VLSDPDHLKSNSINALYSHLLERQNKGLVPFIVLNPGPHHDRAVKKSDKAKGKAKMKYVEVSEGDEGEEKSEEENREDSKLDSRPENSESEEELEELEEPEARVVRFGPPIKKKKEKDQIQVSDDNGVAGPSTLSPPKNSNKKKKMSTPAISSKSPNVPRTLRSKSSSSKSMKDTTEVRF